MIYSIIITRGDYVEKHEMDELFDSLLLELRRGTIVLSVLSQLKQSQYGYSLVVLLEEKGIPVDAGTLYPLLRRLEKQNLLESNWDTEASKPRKYYKLNEDGKKIYNRLCEQWFDMVKSMNNILKS
jgi:PadR family transcriptional regulator, regulatory protein PadR